MVLVLFVASMFAGVIYVHSIQKSAHYVSDKIYVAAVHIYRKFEKRVMKIY